MFGLSHSEKQDNRLRDKASYEENYQQDFSLTVAHFLLVPVFAGAGAGAGLLSGVLLLTVNSELDTMRVLVVFGAGAGLAGLLFGASKLSSLVVLPYAESVKRLEQLQQQQKAQRTTQAYVQPVKVEVWQDTETGAQKQSFDFPNYNLLRQVAQHVLSGGELTQRKVAYLCNPEQYSILKSDLLGAGFVREIDGRGSVEVTSAGRNVLRRLIE